MQATAVAIGGDGGKTDSPFGVGLGGAGGSATSFASGRSSGGVGVIVASTATGGRGGGAIWGGIDVVPGPGGNASASATATKLNFGGSVVSTAKATSFGGVADATAISSGVGNVLANSTATASGASGKALAITHVTHGGGRAIEAQASAPVDGSAQTEAGATFSGGYFAQALVLPALGAGSNDLQAFSYADGVPANAHVQAALEAHPTVKAAMATSQEVIGMGVMGANYGVGAIGQHSYYASVTYSFELAGSGALVLGLLDFTGYGTGFESIEFSIAEGVDVLYKTTLSSLADANAFFSDQALAIGTFDAGPLDLTLAYNLTLNGNGGAAFSYALAGSALVPVPEPEQWALMLAGLGVLGLAARRRKQRTISPPASADTGAYLNLIAAVPRRHAGGCI